MGVLKMCSLFERFHPPPPAGWVTVLERDCQFVTEDVNTIHEGRGLQAQKLVCPQAVSERWKSYHGIESLPTNTSGQVGRN